MADALRTVALVVAAGRGSRIGGLPKQFRPIGGRAVLVHAVEALAHPAIDAVQLVIAPGEEDRLRAAFAGRPLPAFCHGGDTRRDSVLAGLAAIRASGGADRVLVHDAARPFLPPAVIDRLLAALDEAEAAVPVLPVVDTLARQEAGLGAVVPRDTLVRVQTPQAFRFAALERAQAAWAGGEATDEAQVARAAGILVSTVAGDPALEKLTYEQDFALAEARMTGTPRVRTGLGFDVHAFCPGDGLWLGGIRLPHDRGLAGHSDADVLLHAITDALLGTIGAGDIGDHFPPSDPRWKGAPSSLFLEHARDLVTAAGGRIDHVDATLICEAPKIGPHREAIRARVAALLGVAHDAFSLKATTTEKLGFTGRGEGIAAQAVATVTTRERS